MAGPSNRPYDFTEPIYSVIDLEALAADGDLQDAEERVRSPTSSAPGSRPASRGRGDRQHARQQKRREQNKAAQRSFRARKEQHLSELLSRIESLELRKRNIEEENQLLMHELLRKRAENNLLRNHRRASQASSIDTRDRGGDGDGGGGGGGGGGGLGMSTLTRHISLPQEPGGSNRAAGKRPQRDFPGAAEQREKRSRTLPIESLMWLYGPFLDVWSLIREQPAVVRGDVQVDEVLDRLKEMAKFEESAAASRAEGGEDEDERMSIDSRVSLVSSARTVRQRARSL